MQRETATSRRRFLHLTGVTATTVGLAGCSGGGTETTAADTVPDVYRTATAQDGTERNPDGLSSKDSVNYQEQPKNGERCDGCKFYIPDKNDDGTGACAIVEGTVEPDAWCASYVEYDG
jgi:hypothetical protein